MLRVSPRDSNGLQKRTASTANAVSRDRISSGVMGATAAIREPGQGN